jgi:hypothetical protein
MNRDGLQHWIGLGLANGILLGGALAAAHRGHALAVAAVAGILITSTYLVGCRWAAKH